MLNTASRWDIFQETGIENNIENIVETETCRVLRLKGPGGEGLITIYNVFDGVYLMYNDFHMSRCSSYFSLPEEALCVEHCREGRIEHRTDGDKRYYMEPGDMRIDRHLHHRGYLDFPLSHYHGATVIFLPKIAAAAIKNAVPAVSVDIPALVEKFCGYDGLYILRRNSSIEHIFAELYNVPAKIRMDYFRLKVMELLVFLTALETDDYKDERPYFYSGQIEKIKAVHDLITSDLTASYTTEELARRFDISTGALKSGFKSVYGSPIHTYTRAYRMNAAAELLTTHRKRRIIDIASSVGYDNPSKFAAAFKEQFGMTPVEYRGRSVGDTSHN